MTPETPPSSGWIERDEHVLPLRVYYEDTDAAGIVYYANYLKFTERARSELLRLIDVDQSALRKEEGVAFAVRSCAVDYLLPARLDDCLEVRSRIADLRGASAVFDHRICRGGEVLARLDVRIVCLRLTDGRAVRFPERTRAPFRAFTGAGLKNIATATGS